MITLWIVSGIITALMAYWAIMESDLIFSFVLPCGALWMILLGSCAIDNPEWFTLDIARNGAISMVAIGSIIIFIYVFLFIVGIVSDNTNYSNSSNSKINIENSNNTKSYLDKNYNDDLPKTKIIKVGGSKLSIHSKNYVSDWTSKQTISHVVLSKYQDMSLEDLELTIRDHIIDIDGPKYNKNDLIESFKTNCYFIVGSFDNNKYAREFRDELKKHGVKTSVCDDEWINSIKVEFIESKNPIKLKFGDDEFCFDNKNKDNN